MARHPLGWSVAIYGLLGLACMMQPGLAQEAPKPAEPAPVQTPAPEGAVELPKLTVETTPAKKAKSKKATAPKKTQTTQTVQQKSPPAEPERAPETATGPVNGYAATRSATGIKTDTPLREIPQSVSVVGAEQIRDQGASTIQETLRYVPGVFADAYGADSRGDFPRMRGGDPDIFLDGLRISDAWRFGESRLDPYTLERVEVLKGPSSMLYGQTSVAGLINAVSKRPQDETYREVGFEFGSFDRMRLQTDMTGKLTEDGKWLYRFVAVGQDSDMQTDFVDDDRVLIAPSLTYRPTSSTSLTLLGRYQKDDSGSATSFLPHVGTIYPGYEGRRIPIERFVSEPDFDEYKTETASVSALFEHKFSDALIVRQNARYWHTDNIYHSIYPDIYNINDDTGTIFLDPENRTVARYIWMQDTVRDNFASDTNVEMKFATGAIAHKLLTGFDHRRIYQSYQFGEGYDDTPFDLYDPVYDGVTVPALASAPDELQTQSGIYAQDQLRFGNWIGVLGIRHDWAANRVDGDGKEDVEKTTYRAGIMYELPFGLTPYFSYAQSFSPQYQAGCETPCAPYEGEQYEVGFKYQVAPRFAINGALYEVTEQNRLTYGDFDFPKAIGESRTRGGEIEFVGAVTDDLDIIGGYSYTDAIVTKGDEAGKHVPTVPEHQASLWAKYKFSMFGINGFSAGAGVRYVGSSGGGEDVVKTPAVTLVDAMLGWEDDSWRFQINGTNLEDKHYFATCLDRGDCFFGTGRTVRSSLTYKF
jgi:iron complex outermembrane receptor protein